MNYVYNIGTSSAQHDTAHAFMRTKGRTCSASTLIPIKVSSVRLKGVELGTSALHVWSTLARSLNTQTTVNAQGAAMFA